MKIVADKITITELGQLAEQVFGDMVKAVVDIERDKMAVGADMHSDEEALLLEDGSKQQDLWGINLYPGNAGGDFIEFDSLINIRPSQDNRSRGVDDAVIRGKIAALVNKLVEK